jgi:hypothetical protein
MRKGVERIKPMRRLFGNVLRQALERIEPLWPGAYDCSEFDLFGCYLADPQWIEPFAKHLLMAVAKIF